MFNHLKLGEPIEIKLRKKDCYCYTCAREFHRLGIMSHRAAHRNRNEDCQIMYSDGRTFTHKFARPTLHAADVLITCEKCGQYHSVYVACDGATYTHAANA